MKTNNFPVFRSACNFTGTLDLGLVYKKTGQFSLLTLLIAAIFSFTVPKAQAQTPGFSKTGGTTVNSNLLNSINAFKNQFFYLPTDFSATPIAGNITRIYFRNTVASATGTYTNFKVFMGQTPATVFPGTGSLDFFTGLTQVKNSASLTLTGNATAGGWFFIDLDSPFNYDNTKTLIVEIQIGSFTGGINHFSTSSGVVPAHKMLFSSNTSAVSGTQNTNGWPNFGIDITPFPACAGAPTPGNAVSSLSTVCVGAPFELSLTGTSLVTGLTYQWQASANGTTGWTDIPGATGNRLTTSQTATTFYRANVSCGTNTAPSGNVQVTTTAVPMTGTFTIDKNSPASATNYQSFAAVLTDISCKGVSGPVTFNVVANSGPYNEQVIIPAIPGTSATNTITFNGNGNKILFAGSSTNRPVVRLDGADFIKLDNFQIESPDLAFGWGIHLQNGADNNIISNNTITIANTSILEAASAGIFFTNSTNGVTAGNTGSNNLISGNTINGGYAGINLNSVLTATGNNQIRNNIVKDFTVTGIRVVAAKGTIIEGNDLSRPTKNLGSEFYGINLSGNSQLTTISKNRIHNTHDAATGTVLNTEVFGIYLQSSDAPVGSENIIKNNLIYSINNTAAVYAIYDNNSDGAHIFYNTISLDNAASTGALRGFYQNATAINIRFLNNIISITAGTGNKHAIFLDAAASVITSNNNVLYVPNGNVGSFALTDRPTLNDWKAVSGGTYDQNSLAVNPNFVNVAPNNLQPSNSTINNIGQPIAGITEDFTGATRNTTTPDPGAYEFNTPTINHAGITAIISPASSVAPGSSPVEVVFKNYGSAPLTSVSITWSVNSVAQTPFAWTGNLAPGASEPVTLGNFTFTAGTFTLNVCTASPNGQTDGNTNNDCLTLSGNACAPLAGTYTIDKNSAASATNFQTIAAAVQNLTSCGVSAPVVFNVVSATGPYTEQIVLTTIPGANAANTVKFEGNGNKITFGSATAAAIRSVIRLDGADFVTINNFEIEASDPVFGWGIHFQNSADNNTISNNTITIASASTVEANSVGIVFTNSPVLVNTPGNNGNNNIISGNTITGGYKAIHLNSQGAVSSQNQFRNNTIKDFYATAIQISSAKGTVLESNDISRPVRTSAASSITGIFLSENVTATTLSKNRIHGVYPSGAPLTAFTIAIYIANSDAPVGSENIIKNNLIYDINTRGSVYGLYNISSDGAHYFHNTIDLGLSTSTNGTRGFYQSTLATNIKFINNIISITAGTGAKHALYFETPTSAIISNNNVLHVPGGNVGFFSVNKPTLADWKATNNNAYDQNSVADDPSYVNVVTANFQPTSALVNNIGQPVPSVTEDITGVTRNAVTPDPGAYEFLASPIDAGIVAITGPATTGCGLSNAETITVTIKNFGSQTLTSVPVTFSVNGTTIGSETFTGSISGNATATYTFTAKADLSVPGAYSIVAKTVLTSDGNPANDMDTLSRANPLFTTLPVNLNFETTATGLARMKTIFRSQANVKEGAGASNGTGSTKGMIMDGVTSFNWTLPVGVANPWTANPENFAAAYFCVTPGASNPNDSLILTFDLKQLYKQANANTNFRVTVNGAQVGPTYRPPFSGTAINWQRIRVNLTSYKSLPTIEIGLESNVKEEYANGNGTANLIDNIKVERILVPTGIDENDLQNNLVIYPNPSTGNFFVNLKNGNTFTLEVTDLAGKTILRQKSKGNAQLNLETAAKGIYLLKVTSEENSITRKLIVE